MKRMLKKLEDTFAEAALLEMGVDAGFSPARVRDIARESLEEHLVEVAYAEAADYDRIHDTIQREHRQVESPVHPDDCQYGDNELCFVQ